jgi:putative exosortase-associated protein (TIGR04073 family)
VCAPYRKIRAKRRTTMLTTRLHRAVLAAGFATVLVAGAAPAIADESPAGADEAPAMADNSPARAPESIPAPITKLTRGIVNVAFGLPGEIIHRVVGTAHSKEGLQSASSYVGGLVSGLVMGVAWGAVRVESGLIDVVTFPIPFNDNRPLFEPDYPL